MPNLVYRDNDGGIRVSSVKLHKNFNHVRLHFKGLLGSLLFSKKNNVVPIFPRYGHLYGQGGLKIYIFGKIKLRSLDIPLILLDGGGALTACYEVD